MKIWTWFMSLMRRLFGRFQKKAVEEVVRFRNEKWQRVFRFIDTSHGMLNMPKFQLCPECNHPAKRDHKTQMGAAYYCRCGMMNYVTHPLLKNKVQRVPVLR